MVHGVFLGTGSIPTLDRNSQGVLLNFNNTTTVLVDCGEGIQRQLLNVDTDLSKINTIFLTHHHIDHVYGVGGVLVLILNRYPDKVVTIYAPKEAIKIVMDLVNLFIPEKHSRIQYIEVKSEQKIDTDSYSCFTFKTYHTESSVGFCFQSENRNVALLGDVAIPNNYAREQIIQSIYGADIAVIDGVHITVEEAASLASKANIKQLYLLPTLLGVTKEEVFRQASVIFPNTSIPNDFDQFTMR